MKRTPTPLDALELVMVLLEYAIMRLCDRATCRSEEKEHHRAREGRMHDGGPWKAVDIMVSTAEPKADWRCSNAQVTVC